MASIRITDHHRFRQWANDQPNLRITKAEFERWLAFHWIVPAEEGFALTVLGRSLSGSDKKAEG